MLIIEPTFEDLLRIEQMYILGLEERELAEKSADCQMIAKHAGNISHI